MEIFDMEKVIDENKQGQSLVLDQKEGNTKKLFIESYGCQMNFSDSEIVASILYENGYNTTQNLEDADLVLVNTCSIRDKAEQTIRKRLEKYNLAWMEDPIPWQMTSQYVRLTESTTVPIGTGELRRIHSRVS